jgi:hypothetical protein
MCPSAVISMRNRLCLLDDNDWFVQRTVRTYKVRVKQQPHAAITARTGEKIPANVPIVLPRHFFLAMRASTDIPVAARRANRWQHRASRVAAILAGFTDVFFDDPNAHAVVVSSFVDDAFDLGKHLRGELEIRISIFVATCSVCAGVWVDLNRRVRP